MQKKIKRTLFLVFISSMLLSGCGHMRIYKPEIEQGNVFTEAMLDKLKPGMTKAQVKFILGNPVLVQYFDVNRWVYVYQHRVEGKPQELKHVTLHFQGNRLQSVSNSTYPDPPGQKLPVPIVDQLPPHKISQR